MRHELEAVWPEALHDSDCAMAEEVFAGGRRMDRGGGGLCEGERERSSCSHPGSIPLGALPWGVGGDLQGMPSVGVEAPHLHALRLTKKPFTVTS